MFYLITDPSEERYEELTRIAEKRTWPHIKRIKDRMALEKLIDDLKSRHNMTGIVTKDIERQSLIPSRRYSTKF